MGAETYTLIHNLTVPNLPGTKTYEELVELVKDYLCPQPNIIVQRCLFNSRTRQPEESVATFVNELSIRAKADSRAFARNSHCDA